MDLAKCRRIRNTLADRNAPVNADWKGRTEGGVLKNLEITTPLPTNAITENQPRIASAKKKMKMERNFL